MKVIIPKRCKFQISVASLHIVANKYTNSYILYFSYIQLFIVAADKMKLSAFAAVLALLLLVLIKDSLQQAGM